MLDLGVQVSPSIVCMDCQQEKALAVALGFPELAYGVLFPGVGIVHSVGSFILHRKQTPVVQFGHEVGVEEVGRGWQAE